MNYLVPYLIFNSLWYMANGDFSLPIFYPGWTLWFLLSLFFWRFLLKDIAKINRIVCLSIIMGLLVGLVGKYSTLLSFSRTISFLPFFLLGYFTDNETIKKIKNCSSLLMSLGLAVFGVIAFLITKYNVIHYQFFYMSQAYQSFGLNIGQGIFLRILFYLFAIGISICLINLTPDKKLRLSSLGERTLIVYLGHIYLITVASRWIQPFHSTFSNLLLVLILSIFIVGILSLPVFTSIYHHVFGKIGIRLNAVFHKVTAH
jgi:fucose 4-O-acetylase-like acetyltransferase